MPSLPVNPMPDGVPPQNVSSNHGAATRLQPIDPVLMDHHEKMRLRAAAFRSTRLYPGPVGELLSRELLTWEEFGYRLGGRQLVMRLVDHILKTPLDRDAAA